VVLGVGRRQEAQAALVSAREHRQGAAGAAAVNLGQLIGELRMKAEGVSVSPATNEARKADRGLVPLHRADRRAQILALVDERGSVVCRDLVAALGITGGNASVMLLTMARTGKLKRTGETYYYRYSRP